MHKPLFLIPFLTIVDHLSAGGLEVFPILIPDDQADDVIDYLWWCGGEDEIWVLKPF